MSSDRNSPLSSVSEDVFESSNTDADSRSMVGNKSLSSSRSVKQPSTSFLVETVYNDVKDKIHDFSKLTAPEITQFILLSMGQLKQFENMPGSAKRIVVCKVLELLINDMPDGDLKTASQVLTMFLPSFIDNITEYAKGKFDLNNDGVVTMDEVKTKCKSMFCCFRMC
jgi:hypothetical protein